MRGSTCRVDQGRFTLPKRPLTPALSPEAGERGKDALSRERGKISLTVPSPGRRTADADRLPDVLPDTEQEHAPPPPAYVVVLHDDDHNAQEFVVAVLVQVFRYPADECRRLMHKVEEFGQAAVWVGTLEVAELKAEQVVACGPTPGIAGAEPLRVTVEPTA